MAHRTRGSILLRLKPHSSECISVMNRRIGISVARRNSRNNDHEHLDRFYSRANLPHYNPAIELGGNLAMRLYVIDEDVTQDGAGVHNVRTICELGKSVTASQNEIVC